MRPHRFMVIAGEPSGDQLAAELVVALRRALLERGSNAQLGQQPRVGALEPEFFGAGGPHMAGAGVELLVDMTAFAAVGLLEVVRQYPIYRRVFRQLFAQALARQPDAIVCVDFFGFNGRFARAIRSHVARHWHWFRPWSPLIVQYVSPQVWASRPGRAKRLSENCDLLLSIVPFEKQWYAVNAPGLRVEFVGHPVLDRWNEICAGGRTPRRVPDPGRPRVLLLPGSRPDEVRRHLSVMVRAADLIRCEIPGAMFGVVFATAAHGRMWSELLTAHRIELVERPVLEALRDADIAVTKSGTVTLECAVALVPAVVIYKTSWSTYLLARPWVKVRFLAMPNLLAGEAVFPEFIQHAATAENIAQAALDLLRQPEKYEAVQARLETIRGMLGDGNAAVRAAAAIVSLLK